MRFLHHLKKNLSNKIVIWPFDNYMSIKFANIVLVEIFPSVYFHIAGQNSVNKKGRERKLLNDTLLFYGSQYIENNSLWGNDNDNDDIDALVSCSALKYFANKQHGFINEFENNKIKIASKKEGWIFGIF